MNKKTAVVLFNLGGPASLSGVKSFLFNLFYDPAIIRLPNPFRWILAKFISTQREKTAKAIYAQLGGSSPILAITKSQADLLEKALNKQGHGEFKIFISMRYTAPRSIDIIKEIEDYKPDKIVLLPLYPQYSTTTTKSSIDEFMSLINKQDIKIIESYYKDPYFIKAHVELIEKSIATLNEDYRILFSAHGLPENIIKAGDPYQKQIEETVALVVKDLKIKDLDYVICYQSKVGRLKWLEPSTETELDRAAKDEKAVVIVPIAFVSDHSETLVELDIEYKELFEEKSRKTYLRVPALNESKNFTKCLVEQI